ncbi:MAG: hypothetical protein GY749_10260 [Desulfobacteraceae bacterium]|nr:hypothetical protein [Desulfobacteraceae bacterium]
MNESVLKPLQNKLRLYQSVATILYLLTAAGFIIVSAIACDAIFILPQSLREYLVLILIACLLGIMMIDLFNFIRFDDLRAARWVENQDDSLGNVLTNAVQFSLLDSRSALYDVLCSQAIDMGRNTALKLCLWPYVRRTVLRAAISAAAVLAVTGLGALLFNDIVSAVLPRFIDPSGDHPPYSRLKLKVLPGNTDVLYGNNVDIRVKATGGLVEKLYLIAGKKEKNHRFAMFLSPDHTYFQTLSNMTEETWYYVTDGRARSHRFRVSIKYTPKITMLQARLEYPEYTGLPQKRITFRDEPIKLPSKTKLTIRADSNRPLSSGSVSLTPVLGGDIRIVPMKTGEHETTVTGTLIIEQSVVFSISVKDIKGLESARKREGRIDVIPDRRPRVYVFEPGKHAVATPESVIQVHVQAEDDYAVDQILWFRGINMSVERAFKMAIPEPETRTRVVDAKSRFDLKDLGVKPGDIIEYFFEAVDNNPDSPNVSTSRIYSLEIISLDQYREILRRQAANKALFETYEKLGNWLRRLTDRAAHLKEKNDSPEKLESQVQNLVKDVIKYEQAVEGVLAAPVTFDIELSFHLTLARQLEQLRELTGETGFEQKDKADINKIANVLKALTEHEKEQIASPLKQIRAVAMLMVRAERFTALAKRQEEIVRFARRFSSQQELSRVNRTELMEIGGNENHVSKELAGLIEQLFDLIEQLPRDRAFNQLRNSVRRFCYEAEGLEIISDLDRAWSGFSELDGPKAYPLAVSALEKMQQLISKCNSLGREGEQALNFQPSVNNKLGNTMQQILGTISGYYGQEQNSGYSMISENSALYGPDVEFNRNGNSGQGKGGVDKKTSDSYSVVDSDADDPELETPDSPGRVKLIKDMKFPIRYRKLIGDYFRKVSEVGSE